MKLTAVSICVFFLLCFAPVRHTRPVSASQSVKRADAQGNVRALVTRQAVCGKLPAGEIHRFQLALASGQYARVRLEAWGVKLRLSIQNPGEQSPEDYTCEAGDQIYVSLVTRASGLCHLALNVAGEQGQAGQYELSLEESRQSRAGDADRIAADGACREAGRLRAMWKVDSAVSAAEKYEEARGLFSALRDRRGEAAVLRKIADTHLSLNDARRALEYYTQARSLARAANSVGEESNALNGIAYTYVSRGENKDALDAAQKALRASGRAGNRAGQARALHTIGDSHYGLGNLQRSLEYYRRALELWRQLGDYGKQAEVLVSFGYAYVDLSDIERAFNVYDEALRLSRAAPDRHAEAFTLRAIGNLQTKLGENQRALDCFNESLKILQTTEDRLLKATVLAGLGYIHDRLSDFQKAIEYFDEAIGIFRAIDNRWGEAETLMDCGLAYYSLGEHHRALENYEQALSSFTSLGMSRYVAQTLRNMGLIFDSLGNKARALACYRRSLALTRKGQDQRYEAYTLNYIGRFCEGLGDAESALGYYRQALPLNRVASDRLGESLTLYNIARVERGGGNLDAARAQVETAIDLAESLRTKVANKDLRIKYFASAHQYYELYIDVLMAMHKERPGAGLDVLAFEAAERARARALLEMLREADAEIRQGVDAVLLERERLLRHLLDAKSERLAAGRGGSEADALSEEIEKLAAEHDDVRRRINESNPEYAALMQPGRLSLEEIRRAIDEDTVLLEYSLGKEKSYLWAISKTAINNYELPGRTEIEEVAARASRLLTSAQMIEGETLAQRAERMKESEKLYWQDALRLSDALLRPAAQVLRSKRLVIVADGVLQYVPFGALPDPDSPRDEPAPMVLGHEITYEPSASTLATLRDRATRRRFASKAIAVLADPVFERDDSRLAAGVEEPAGAAKVYPALRGGPSSDRDVPRLIASRDEAEAIMAMIPAGFGLKATDFDASKQMALSSSLGDYRIVHFATHGIFNGEEPEKSGLVLSLFDREGKPQDGFLGLSDIYNLNLPVDMVVLSACNTGLGKYIKGEGLVGLTRGFMYAGAARVLASLWRVDDEATAELMKNFYGKILREKKSPASALREAQVAMWQHKRWRSPYFWAAFVLQGEYEGRIDIPETGRGHALQLFMASALALLLIGGYVISRVARRKNYGE